MPGLRENVERELSNRAYIEKRDWRVSAAHEKFLQTAPCSFCNAKHGPSRGYYNVARKTVKLNYTDANTLPCCALCFRMRHGLDPLTLRAICRRIVAYQRKERPLPPRPAALGGQGIDCVAFKKRMKQKCGDMSCEQYTKLTARPCGYCGVSGEKFPRGLDRISSKACYCEKNTV